MLMDSDKTNITGLDMAVANRRLRHDGYNEVVRQKRFAGAIALAARFKNPLIIILALAAILSGFLGDRTSAVIILVIVAVSTLLDFVNTYKSDKAAEALKSRVRVSAAVQRSGQLVEVPVRNLVVGDVVLLRAGDIVPADGGVVNAEHFYINESVLNGESFPKPKQAGEELFMGSSTVSGSAYMTVTATGFNTKFSHIATSISGHDAPTEFDREIKDFSLLIIRITFGLVLFVFLVNALLKHNLLDSLLFSVALAVGLTPELLPMIITLNLTKGSLAMAKRGVIVKKLSAIENFGSMDILCTDKTGTLTEDHIELVKYVDGYGHESEAVLCSAYVASEFESGFKSPLDDAIKAYRKIPVSGYHKLTEIPFDFKRRRSSVVVRHKGEVELITKGAPEEVVKICATEGSRGHSMTEQIWDDILCQYQQLSREGFRVLAVASKRLPAQTNYEIKDEADMTFVGFVAFLDPAKKTVAATLLHMHDNGIEVKILTGDNDLVTGKIARDIGLPIKGVMTGAQIAKMSITDLTYKVESTTVFARVDPEQKMRIIELLQSNGHVVGYMGDGINDAPSLKAADTGISVNNAVDIAKDTADMILIHKSLADLIEGVLEGRRTFANTLKYLKMALSSNFGNMFSVAGASLLLPFLPMLAPQILLNNLISDGAQITLPLDAVDLEEVQRPRVLKIAALKKFMWVFGPLSSLFDFITFFTLFIAFGFSGSRFQTGWFIESMATQLLVVYVLRTRRLPFLHSNPSIYVLCTTLAGVGTACLIALSAFGHFFHFTSLPLLSLAAIVCIVAAYLLLVQLVKTWFYARVDL